MTNTKFAAAIAASATALALDALCGLQTARTDLALLCQRAENEFVRVRSGIMDQYAALLCQQGHALLIDCRSLESEQVSLDLAAAGLSLVVTPIGTADEEDWRLFAPGIDGPHFVIEGGRIAPDSLA